LNEQIVRAIHADQLSQHGASSGIRDENLLSASLSRPQNLLTYGDASVLFDLATAYGYGFAKNHPFVDGNKRVAFIAMAIFLELNGYSLDVPEVDVVVMIERLATDQENQDSIAEWLRENSLKQKSWAN
jgi:death-on-curing protein